MVAVHGTRRNPVAAGPSHRGDRRYDGRRPAIVQASARLAAHDPRATGRQACRGGGRCHRLRHGLQQGQGRLRGRGLCGRHRESRPRGAVRAAHRQEAAAPIGRGQISGWTWVEAKLSPSPQLAAAAKALGHFRCPSSGEALFSSGPSNRAPAMLRRSPQSRCSSMPCPNTTI